MPAKPPIFWNGLSFPYSGRNDIVDRWEGSHGGLTYGRSNGVWLAYLHGACGSAGPFPELQVEPADGARAALEKALVALRKRVASDQKFLAYLEDELGLTAGAEPALTNPQGRAGD